MATILAIDLSKYKSVACVYQASGVYMAVFFPPGAGGVGGARSGEAVAGAERLRTRCAAGATGVRSGER